MTKLKLLNDKLGNIKRNNYVKQQRSDSLEEVCSSDQNIHSIERQLQRLNELDNQERVLISNEISSIERT